MTDEPSKPGVHDSGSNSAFGLQWIFYATALIASGMAVWGSSTILFSVLILIFWATWFAILNTRYENSFALRLLLVLLFLLALLGLSLPQLITSRRSFSRRAHCKNDMRQFVLAMHSYDSSFGQFPEAVKTVNGNPHSWRTTLLPYLERGSLFDLYDESLPWDADKNMLLTDNWDVATTFRTEDHHDGKTAFKLVVGDGTFFQSNGSRMLDSITDGTANTILLIEDRANPVYWSQPKDIDIEEAIAKLSGLTAKDAVYSYDTTFTTTHYGPNFVCADGSVHSIGFGATPESLRRAFCCADGKMVDIEQLGQPLHVIKYHAVISLIIYIGLILFPIWTYRRHSKKLPATKHIAT